MTSEYIMQLERHVARLETALHAIFAIEDRYTGSDWEEIEEARQIAGKALDLLPAVVSQANRDTP